MYRRRLQGWLKHIDFILFDLVSMHMALLISYAIRHHSWGMYQDDRYQGILLPITLINLFVSIMMNSFKKVLRRSAAVEFYAAMQQVCIVMLILLTYLFLTQTTYFYSRQTIVGMLIIYLCLSFSVRMLWKLCLVRLVKVGGCNSLMVVTTGAMAVQVVENVRKFNYERYVVTGLVIVDGNRRGEEISGIPVVAGSEDAVEFICREWVDEVLIALPPEISTNERLVEAFHQMGVAVHIALTQRTGTEGLKQQIGKLGNYNVLTSTINYVDTLHLFLKRLLDILGGLTGCMATLVLCIFIGPAICLESPGPIFFSQIRVGKNGRKFKIYKFRSMYMDAEERKKELLEQNKVSDGMMFKMDWDPRIIGCKILPDGTRKKGIGNYIRDLSLDEFPQFWNVLKGDMSLVGTRPPTLDEWEKYEPWHRTRLAVKPGITGMWQVSGRSNITDFEEVVKLDTQYISQWSIGLDLKILVKTVGVVLKRDGAV